ncbi:Dyp-type peroxidase [Rhizobium mesoamericanum]|uniref:Dyp-type peroxidase n=1 Tax=Rhizobium mesoamericanum TaxID=1079800 RepID=UPI00040AD1D9|nr:Dyp-type peroxidase [Rhizobium mesoamericanum]
MLATSSSPILTSADLKANLSDIQDNIVAPILMRYGRHVFIKFTDSVRARTWLREIFNRVNARSEEHGTRFTVNIGFTHEGLKTLGLSERALNSFPEAFRIGARGRAIAVRDVGPHAPEHWEGGLGGPDIHAMVLVRTDSDEGREEATRILQQEMGSTGGLEIRFIQDTMASHESGIGSEGEHFGFADPISQPPIEGADTPSFPGDGVLESDGTWRPLKPGEFLLGYEDEVGPGGTQMPEPFELRVNGTFVVFRKLYQDVAAFRRYLATAARSLYGSDDQHHRDLVAAKIMGRWPSGCPLDLSPEKDDPEIAADPDRRNNFTYEGDEQGLRCPLGSHLRRSNPRATPLKRATAVRRHRLLRRGVEYGPHFEDGALEDDGVDRGLINLFIQADIERQFEFVQAEWMKGGEFLGLDPNEQDPINGVGGEGSQMSVPGAKRPFLFDLPTFVTVKGGEYLFVPGLNALRGIIEQKF